MANTIVVVGKIFGEPRMAYTQQGKAVVNFKVTDSKKNKDGTYTNIQFDCTLWGEQAETFVKFFHDKSAIVISGRAEESRIWTTKDGDLYLDKNGQPGSSVKMGFINWDFPPKDQSTEFSGPPQIDGAVLTSTEDSEYGG